ncbi:MAG: hypothetical protein AB7J13_03585 [Pyrinomonadaceae bacterium]
MRLFRKQLIFVALIVLASCLNLAAQTKKNTAKRPAAKAAPTATPESVEPVTTAPEPGQPAKRNRRAEVADTPAKTTATKFVPAYFYIFTRPGFTYSRIEIVHDDSGRGTISFQKTSFDETIVDPIELSASTMSNIRAALTALDFLDSTEEYQYARDYSHMGIVEFRFRENARERTVKYNWTENKHAKDLADVYRRISNEYTWRFEIITARENYPLLTPGLMDTIDAYVRRGEISDPPHLVPFLNELSNDERIPLMGRNVASKLIKQIEKGKK